MTRRKAEKAAVHKIGSRRTDRFLPGSFLVEPADEDVDLAMFECRQQIFGRSFPPVDTGSLLRRELPDQFSLRSARLAVFTLPYPRLGLGEPGAQYSTPDPLQTSVRVLRQTASGDEQDEHQESTPHVVVMSKKVAALQRFRLTRARFGIKGALAGASMIERRVDHDLRQRNAALDMLEAAPEIRNFYRDLVRLFTDEKLPFLVGGTFAFQRYTGISRPTKDLDFFIRRDDYERFKSVLRGAGFHVELTFPHWLGKVFKGDKFADLAFRSANGEGAVDAEWFEHAVTEELWGIPILLCPPEETIWSKSFIMERERFDGADINHILRATAPTLDWDRLLRRFGKHWRVLLIHLISFGFVYPNERNIIPEGVMRDLMDRLRREVEDPSPLADDRLCRGTLISREQYLSDVHEDGYVDARIEPHGKLTEAEVDSWTAAIDR